MDQLNLLLFLSFAMLIGSFLAGTVPMAFKLSEARSRLLALLGSGILVGTALAIIIPEGIDALYSSQQHPHISMPANRTVHGDQISDLNSQPPKTFIIGISLVVGFVLMFLIDQFSIYQGADHHHDRTSSTLSKVENHEYSLANQYDDEDDDDSETVDNQFNEKASTNAIISSESIIPSKNSDTHRVSMKVLEPKSHAGNNHQTQDATSSRLDFSPASHQVKISRQRSNKVTPTLGLVIHAAADGIALGAAATTSHRDVEMIIFLAIMLHKGPAAFSLVVFLLHRGINNSTIRRHLLAFSLSAPLAALLTYFGLSQSGKEALRQNNATGIAMLFSAGTFLYVATVHVLPELVNNRLLSRKELAFLIGGSFVPILLAQTV